MWSHVAAQTRASPQPSVATAVTDIRVDAQAAGGRATDSDTQDQTSPWPRVASRPPTFAPSFTAFSSPDLPLSLPYPVTYLFTITVPDHLAPQGGLRASFPHPGQTALGWHMCVRLCLLGPSGAKPNVYLLLLPNYRYNTTNASLSCQRDGL